METQDLIEVRLSRIVIREGSDRQHIYMTEREGSRGFPIVIGTPEAVEIHRIVRGFKSERPLTHQLAHNILDQMGGKLVSCSIVDLRHNTYYARLDMLTSDGREVKADARPSDAIALVLRAGGKLFVNESVLEQNRTDREPDELPPTA